MPVAPATALPPVVSIRVGWLVALGLVVITLLLHAAFLGQLPAGIHSWAQADRLALALSFHDHGLNLLRPQTLNLSSVDGVVGVEFPIIAYLAALGGKFLGRAAIVPVFRLLTLLCAVLGAWYAFRLVYERTGRLLLALVPAVFFLSSPVVAYYASNFLPDVPAASFCLVGYYYFMRFEAQRHFPDLVRAGLLLALGALLKISTGIYLLAVVGVTVWWAYREQSLLSRRQMVYLSLLLLAALSAVIGYALYNRHLNALYSSTLFMAQAKPLESYRQLDALWIRIRDLWAREYLTPLHYAVLVGALLLPVGLRAPRRHYGNWYMLLVLILLGSLSFFGLMAQQYFDHDYYIIAPFAPGIVLWVALAALLAACYLPVRLANVGAAFLVLGLVVWGGWRLWQRHQEPYLPFSTYYDHHWPEGGAAALQQAGVPDQATLLVVGVYAPNTALVYFNRRGLTWNPDLNQAPITEIEQRMADYGLSHLVMPRYVFDGWWPQKPQAHAAFRLLVKQAQFVVLVHEPQVPHWP